MSLIIRTSLPWWTLSSRACKRSESVLISRSHCAPGFGQLSRVAKNQEWSLYRSVSELIGFRALLQPENGAKAIKQRAIHASCHKLVCTRNYRCARIKRSWEKLAGSLRAATLFHDYLWAGRIRVVGANWITEENLLTGASRENRPRFIYPSCDNIYTRKIHVVSIIRLHIYRKIF